MTTVRWLWIVLLVAVVALEFYALGHPAKGDTLSENVWLVRGLLVGRIMVGALFAWLWWHFSLDRWNDHGIGDIAAVVLGGLLAVLIGPRKPKGTDDTVA